MAGACNLNSVTLEEAVDQIRFAVDNAVTVLNGYPRGSWPVFRKVWVGIADFHHSRRAKILTSHLEGVLGVSASDESLSLTSDNSLLSSCMGFDSSVEGCITLIAGTGAVATAFKLGPTGEIDQVDGGISLAMQEVGFTPTNEQYRQS
jgi:N-acetylmuramic acid 6-phosphate etherase